jgi:hypothetical protein
VLIQQIEDGALHRVEGDNLNCLALVHLAHVDVVVEIEGPGMLRRDLLVLKARLREHQRLRVDRDFQQLQYRFEIAELRLVLEFPLALIQFLLQYGHRVAQVL